MSTLIELIWTTEQIERHARAYQDQFREGEPGFGVVSDFSWSFHAAVPLDQVDGSPESWCEWWNSEKSYDPEFDYPRCADIEEWYRSLGHADPRDPVFLVQGTDYVLHLWDGNHRVGAAHTLGYTTVPAFVGTRRNWTGAQIERIATFHQDFREFGEPACGAASDFNWSYVSALPLDQVGGGMEKMSPDDWKQWWSVEKSSSTDEDTARRCSDIECWYRSLGYASPLHPIVLAQGSDGVLYLWDGHHRVAAAHVLGYGNIPAFVGMRGLADQ
jgi:hypothetical protein